MSFHAFADLHLMDMPEGVHQQISSYFYARQWATGPALTCRTLNRLSLPVLKVWSECIDAYLLNDRLVHFKTCANQPHEHTSDSVAAWALQRDMGW